MFKLMSKFNEEMPPGFLEKLNDFRFKSVRAMTKALFELLSNYEDMFAIKGWDISVWLWKGNTCTKMECKKIEWMMRNSWNDKVVGFIWMSKV
jgi:hypothetical protein